ncbi:MAG: DUF4248 domain-containing protein [Bacteroidia bacterium]|nr:DUF4248 domain-containing protein [Bacteroidia bacterium]
MKEQEFQIRTYGFGELACLYFPKCTKKSASRIFSQWIHGSPKLISMLKEYGWEKGKRSLTPKQVRILVDFFDPPDYF